MINILGRRFPYAKAVLYPALVQGSDAPPQLIRGVRYFNEMNNVDVIIIGRGGGSIEDLWAFNSEELAREIANSKIPVISAVGHETDFTICDFVADRRAPTPSAAAELAVPETAELKRKINNIVGRTELLLMQNLQRKKHDLRYLSESRALVSPGVMIDDRRMTAAYLFERLEGNMRRIKSDKEGLLAKRTAALGALNPLSVISRGYSAVFTESGKLVKSVDDISAGDRFSFKTSDGTVRAVATETLKESI